VAGWFAPILGAITAGTLSLRGAGFRWRILDRLAKLPLSISAAVSSQEALKGYF
jgi:hypothetical protein